MGYSLRQMSEESKWFQHVKVNVLEQVVPSEVLYEVLSEQQAWEQRERKLNMAVVFWVVMAMSLYPSLSQGDVLERISQGVRYVWPDEEVEVATKGAISQRRQQLGVKPMVEVFHRCCRPLATEQSQGAWHFGLRVMAWDSTLEDVPDTPANAKVFGYLHNQKGRSPFPKVRGVYLMECGTHAIIDAGFWPCRVGDITGAKRLLRSVQPGMLLLWDSGFHSAALVAAAHWQRGAEVVGKLASTDVTRIDTRLSDGTALATLYPEDPTHRKGRELPVRVIEYTISEPGGAQAGETHRLLTTLLDPEQFPAEEVIALYHERWEIETAIDEVDTHQRLLHRTLRSQTPTGVMQELYGMVLGYYAVRALMHQAALQAGIDVDRLSFVECIHVLHMAVPEFQMTADTDRPRLGRRLLRDLARHQLPPRRLRFNPRCIKRKGSRFRVKRPETPPGITLQKTFLQLVTLI